MTTLERKANKRMTIEEAAVRYIKSVEDWEEAKARHKRLYANAVCELGESYPDPHREGEFLRCSRIEEEYHYLAGGEDCTRMQRMPSEDFCEACQQTFKWYRECHRLARIKGQAHAALRRAVKNAYFLHGT